MPHGVTLVSAMGERNLPAILSDILANKCDGDVNVLTRDGVINESYFYRLLRGKVKTLGRNKLDSLCEAFPTFAAELRDAAGRARAEALKHQPKKRTRTDNTPVESLSPARRLAHENFKKLLDDLDEGDAGHLATILGMCIGNWEHSYGLLKTAAQLGVDRAKNAKAEIEGRHPATLPPVRRETGS